MDRSFKNVDLFAGKAEIAKAFKRRGMRSIALDLERSAGDAACTHITLCSPRVAAPRQCPQPEIPNVT